MKKYFIFLLIFALGPPLLVAQKAQRVGYIDMEYILENVPEYNKAQNLLDSKVAKWRKKLDEATNYIEKLKQDLINEKAILTKDIILEKEDEILLKQEEFRRLELAYFGPNGDMYQLRRQLVQPIQDQVYNAVQTLATSRKYDFIFDKSSELVMLYSNKKYDISDLVIKSIVRDRKINERKTKQEEAKNKLVNKELTDAQIQRQKQREQALKKKEEDRLAKKKKIEETRKKRLAEIEAKRKLLRDKKEAAKKKREEDKKEQNNN